MASYHYDKSKGCMVKCNTADPNGVCRIHGNTDIKADTADEAQRKFNAMKIDEANAEDMSEMPLEYVTEVWKIHCDSINEGNDDGMGPKTIDAIANKPGIWESLDENAAGMLAESANSVNDDAKNVVMLRFGNQLVNLYDRGTHIIDSAPEWALKLNGYKSVTDVLGDICDYFGAEEASEYEVRYWASFACAYENSFYTKVAHGVNRGPMIHDEDGNSWVNEAISRKIKCRYFDEYEQQRYYKRYGSYFGAREDYMNSEQYQQEKSDYYNAMGLSL